LPPIEALRANHVPIAVATDCNPGSSPMVSLLTAMSMACTLFRLSPEEALAGVTRNAAWALGLQDEIGTLEVGKAADFAVWPVMMPWELCYWIGGLRPSYVHSSFARHA
jgi:imidazolonepropionase